MRHCQQADCSSNDSNGSDIESCFDTENEESDPDTNSTDVDIDVERNSGADISWLLDENKDHPPEYYLNQEDEFDKSKYMGKDYSDNSCLFLDFIEERFFQYCRYTCKDPKRTIRDISLCDINAFFDWLLNQRRGKGGRRVCSIRSANTLGIYWKVFRLIHERATGEKIRGEINWKIHRMFVVSPQIIRKLVKKHKLTKGKHEKTAMNKFSLPEIIFDSSLILSPHVFLLGLIFADRAFVAPNLTSANQLSRLDIRPGYQ
ncbi:MAG: hypothetical protein M1840_002004 [Geoglossum simile]|nr:MAG: hypothetical protein M1840_002004 [Geoglossum simile]